MNYIGKALLFLVVWMIVINVTFFLIEDKMFAIIIAAGCMYIYGVAETLMTELKRMP